jgi:hydrogenase nickel incorporation protein HypA/HybF
LNSPYCTHETDMTKALILTVRDWWEKPARSNRRSSQGSFLTVGSVHLRRTGWVSSLPLTRRPKGTFLDGAELVIQRNAA